MKKKKYTITESQLETIIKKIIKEQGLYGDQTDVVDYDLPEYLSDVIILQELTDFNDVEKSIKELHKRLIRLEKGVTTAGSSQKAYGDTYDYSSSNKKFKNIDSKLSDKERRDQEQEKEIENLKKMLSND